MTNISHKDWEDFLSKAKLAETDRTDTKKVSCTLVLHEDQKTRLQMLAVATGCSMSDVVGRLIDSETALREVFRGRVGTNRNTRKRLRR